MEATFTLNVEVISPYKLAELAEVRPQMVYNYIKSGKIKVSANSTGKKEISKTEAERWVNEHRAAQKARAIKKAQKVKAELKGEALTDSK